MVSLVYTYTSGVKGVIWVDVIQMFIYLGGALTAAAFILYLLPGGWNSVFQTASEFNKLSVFNPGFENGIKEFFLQPYTLAGGILGGAFLSMASHGTDQLIVQRLLTAKDLAASRKAVIGSGVIIIIQFAVFLILGIMLFAFYGKIDIKADEIFPMFIINVLPPGVSGIIIAGLFAAAMSTLADSMSSLSSSTMMDLYLPFRKNQHDEKKNLFVSRMFTVMWCGLLVVSALFFMETTQAVVEIALSNASFTFGGLLGTFLLGIFVKRAKHSDAMIAFTAGILVMFAEVIFKLAAWTWFIAIGVSVTLLVGTTLSRKK